MPSQLKVTQASSLLAFLQEHLPERSRNSLKSLLHHRQVSIDGATQTRFDHLLAPGQVVTIRHHREILRQPAQGVRIVHEDADLLVVEKPCGLLSVGTERERERTAYRIVSDHVKQSHLSNRIFIVHRLDRETSGLMLFAKHQAIQESLQRSWTEVVDERLYVAVVEGQVRQPQGTITSWLKENRAQIMVSSTTPNGGQKATTHFRVLQSTNRFSLLELQLDTGRKNQIRVHLQHLGHSILGDLKYGATQDPLRRIALHARVLAFRHPSTGQPLRFETPIPTDFLRLFPPGR